MEFQACIRNRIIRVLKNALILLLLSGNAFAYDVNFHPTRLKTPEDALIFLFPIIDKLRIIQFRDLSMKLDFKTIKIKKRDYIPGPNGKTRFFIQYSQYGGLQLFTEAQFAYTNHTDIDRWVFFPPTGYAIGARPIAIGSTDANNGSQLLLILRTTWGNGRK